MENLIVTTIEVIGPTEILERLRHAIEASATEAGEGDQGLKAFHLDRLKWVAEFPEWGEFIDLEAVESCYPPECVKRESLRPIHKVQHDGRPVRIVDGILVFRVITVSYAPHEFVERLGDLFPVLEITGSSLDRDNGVWERWRVHWAQTELLERRMSAFDGERIWEWVRDGRLWEWTNERNADIMMLQRFLELDVVGRTDADDLLASCQLTYDLLASCQLAYDAMAFPSKRLASRANGYAYSLACTIAEYRHAVASTPEAEESLPWGLKTACHSSPERGIGQATSSFISGVMVEPPAKHGIAEWSNERDDDIRRLQDAVQRNVVDGTNADDLVNACQLAYDAMAFPRKILGALSSGYAYSLAITIASYRQRVASMPDPFDVEEIDAEPPRSFDAKRYKAFETGLKTLLGTASDQGVGDDQLCEALVDYLDERVQSFGSVAARDWALRDFRKHLSDGGRDTIADLVIEWAEEMADDIRWPVAYVYTVTGKLPGGYRDNTTIVMVVEDRQHKIVGYRVFHWEDYATLGDEQQCHFPLYYALDECAVSLGARSVFTFTLDGQPCDSKSIYHDPEQGPHWSRTRFYRDSGVDSQCWLHRLSRHAVEARLDEALFGRVSAREH